jgi:hypothetical protein
MIILTPPTSTGTRNITPGLLCYRYVLFCSIAAQRISYGRQGPLGPRLHFRTPRDGFPITGLLSTQAFVIGTPLWAITRPRSLAHAQLELNFRSAFTTPLACALGPQTHSALVPSRVPALRQLIPGITLSLCFLGHPTPPCPAVGYLLQLDLREPRRVSPFRVSIFHGFGTILYAVSLISSGCHV